MSELYQDVNCAVPYCGQLIARAKPGSYVEAKCHRCYAITEWDDGKTAITRPPKRYRDASGRWITMGDADDIDKLMREHVAVEGVNVRRSGR